MTGRNRKARAGAAAVLLGGSLALAGCGSGGGGGHAAATPTHTAAATTTNTAAPTGQPTISAPQSPTIAATDGPALAARAEQLLKNASSMRIRGTVTKAGSGARSVDLRIDRSGHLEGSLHTDGQTVQLRATGPESAYLKASDAFWAAHGGSAVAKLFHDKWIKATGSQAKELTGDISLDSFTRSVHSDSKAELAGVTAGRQRTIDGVPAIPLTGFPKHGGASTTTGTVWVRATGEPYPVRLQGTGGGSGDVIHLSDYDQPVTVTAPPASEVVDLSELESTPTNSA